MNAGDKLYSSNTWVDAVACHDGDDLGKERKTGTSETSRQEVTEVAHEGREGVGKSFRFDSPIGVVMRLYHDFSFQAVMDPIGLPYDDVLNQPRAVLERYFTEPVIKLIAAERRCAAAQGEICNIDFMPLWASQDATGVVVQISQGGKPNEVVAALSYPGETEKLRLTYALAKTDRGRRVSDIQGRDWSLSSTLSGK